MPVRCVTFDVDVIAGSADARTVLEQLAHRYVLGLLGEPSADLPDEAVEKVRGLTESGILAFRLSAQTVGISSEDARMFTMAAAAARCYPNEVVHVGGGGAAADAVRAVGGRAVTLLVPKGDASRRPGMVGADEGGESSTDDQDGTAAVGRLSDLPAVIDRFETADHAASGQAGIGPRPEPWPEDDHLDAGLLEAGDRRNVVDRYRYWREDAIVADLDRRRHGFHVAVENWRHDRNIGAVVRNANAFGAAGVHIVGRRRWNRRGAMATDRYLPVHHHDSTSAFMAWAEGGDLPVIGIDNVEGSISIESAVLPERCVLVFGQEGPGLSPPMLEQAEQVLSIAQYGSTRSINAGVASGIAMHAWVRQHVVEAD